MEDGNSGQADEQPDDRRSVVIHRAFEQIGNERRLAVLYDLQADQKRFNEIKRSTGMNSATLSRTLDDLQELGFVTRRSERGEPFPKYYSTTAKGESLEQVFDALEQIFSKSE